MRLLTALQLFKKKFSRYTPTIEIRLSKSSLLHNLHTYQRSFPQHGIAPVLKSNAYGHGLLHIARRLDPERLPFFVVDNLYEARLLRREGIRTPSLVVGYTSVENLCRHRGNGISFALTGLEHLEMLATSLRRPLSVHLKVDTGMYRHGVRMEDLPRAISILRSHFFLHIEGVCSHFADAEQANSPMTKTQEENWRRVLAACLDVWPNLRFRHVSATAAARIADPLLSNTMRIGSGLYGFDKAPLSPLPLRPVLSLHSIITSVKNVPMGLPIGYGGTHRTLRPSVLATVPVGYFEGVDRRLSNIGCVLINDQKAPIVGRVSMNMLTVDVTDIPHPTIGDPVCVISADASAPNMITRMAEQCDTIARELLVHIPGHLRRIVVD